MIFTGYKIQIDGLFLTRDGGLSPLENLAKRFISRCEAEAIVLMVSHGGMKAAIVQ